MDLSKMLAELGGREDDHRNYFTARMLLMLESHPLVNEEAYNHAIGKIVDAYCRDYPTHATEFRPTFLINDIIRYWKTMCLNYEHKRNRPDDDVTAKRKQQVRNFKLKFSRMLTCFGTVTALCALDQPHDPASIVSVLRNPPLDRLLLVTQKDTQFSELLTKLVDDYGWFLECTKLSTTDLTKQFENRETKLEMFDRADKFGDIVFEILSRVCDRTDYMRYVVI